MDKNWLLPASRVRDFCVSSVEFSWPSHLSQFDGNIHMKNIFDQHLDYQNVVLYMVC